MVKAAQWDAVLAGRIIEAHASADGAALPILHALQDEFGYINDEALLLVARALNLSRAEVHGIITFYDHFRCDPPGRHVLKICRAEACQAMGATKLADDLLRDLDLDWCETTSDGQLTVEGVYCLGLCACAPSALFDGHPIGRLDAETLARVAQQAQGQ